MRIKTLQALYAWQQSDGVQVDKGIQALRNDLLKTHDMYLFLLEFPWYLQQYLESERDLEKSKFYPNKELIREYEIFSKTPFASRLFDKAMRKKRTLFRVEWPNLAENFDTLYQACRSQEFMQDFLVFEDATLAQQQWFFEQFYTYLIQACEPFHQLMEENYAAWNDDEQLLLREVVRTIASGKEDGTLRLSDPDSPTGEDIQFGLTLFEKVAVHHESFEQRVADITDNWDPARIALLDMIAIKMALAEFLHFNEIPLKVTINEYLDIVKDYSTPNSSRFLNGVLDKMRKKLESSGEIRKVGRGLRDN